MGCVESIGSFQLSVCFMKACRASAHAQQTKQNETSEQRELKRDTEYRKSKEKSRVVLCFVEVVGSFSHRVQVEGEGW